MQGLHVGFHAERRWGAGGPTSPISPRRRKCGSRSIFAARRYGALIACQGGHELRSCIHLETDGLVDEAHDDRTHAASVALAQLEHGSIAEPHAEHVGEGLRQQHAIGGQSYLVPPSSGHEPSQPSGRRHTQQHRVAHPMFVSDANRNDSQSLGGHDPGESRELAHHPRCHRTDERHGQILALLAAKRALKVVVQRIQAEAAEDQERHGTGDAERRKQRSQRSARDFTQHHHATRSHERSERQAFQQASRVASGRRRLHRLGRRQPDRPTNCSERSGDGRKRASPERRGHQLSREQEAEFRKAEGACIQSEHRAPEVIATEETKAAPGTSTTTTRPR